MNIKKHFKSILKSKTSESVDSNQDSLLDNAVECGSTGTTVTNSITSARNYISSNGYGVSMNGGIGSLGAYYGSGTAGGGGACYTYSGNLYSISSSSSATLSNAASPNYSSISISGDTKITGDLIVNGISVIERIENIEKRLAILQFNTALEDKWSVLKELGDKYRELEKEILEKEEIWSILKK